MLVLAPLVLASLPQVPDADPETDSPPREEIAEVASHLQGTDSARRAAMAWLAAFQDADGRWDCDGFAKHAAPGRDRGAKGDAGGDVFWDDAWLEDDAAGASRAAGANADAGEAAHDVGVTGLALLALMADGNTRSEGPHREQVGRGLDWLRSAQSRESGLLGEAVGHAFMYDHGIASLALVEALRFERTPEARGAAQKAMNYIARARNPYGVWRYEMPPNGDNDTSVTTWMVMAMDAARRADLSVDTDARQGAIGWFDAVTDSGTGRVGYTEVGSPSSRVPGINDRFPSDSAETLTAAGLLCRLTLGQKPAQTPALIDHVKLILRSIPDEAPEQVDDALWVLYGTLATSWIGGRPWREWSRTFAPAVVAAQTKEGPGAGSWDPKNAWGFSMGRVGTTALMAWTLASIRGHGQ